MGNTLRRGFKAEAERLALELRAELGLKSLDRLDPKALADHFGIPVVNVLELVACGAAPASVRHLTGKGRREFSAATVFCGTSRLVIANPVHSSGRQTNSIVHELSHVTLEHTPSEGISRGGCRIWSANQEQEADWLAATLLVPREAALAVARKGADLAAAAKHFGVSVALIKWRLNHTGALRQALRERGAGRPWPVRAR